ESGEKHVFGDHLGSAQAVEQGGFPGVCVTDDRGVGSFEFLALLALGAPLFPNRFEFALAAINPDAGEPAVHLDLLLAHAAGGTGTAAPGRPAAFAVEVTPHASHPRKGILHAREVDLKPRLAGLR